MAPVDLRIDAIRVSLGATDTFRIVEQLEETTLGARLQMAAAAGTNTETIPVPVDDRDDRLALAAAVERVIERGHSGENLESQLTLHRLRCLLIEAGQYVPPWG